MSVTGYADNAAGNAVGLFPEGMQRSQVNDSARILQADIRELANQLPFFDVGTGSGTAVYTFVSANSFNVDNTDVSDFYTSGRRIQITSASIGTVVGTVDSATFNSPSTLVTVSIDGGVALLNEPMSVSLSILDPTGVPPTSTSPSLTLISTDPGSAGDPLLDLFRDSASPAAGDVTGIIDFSGRDSSGSKVSYNQIESRISDATDGSEDATLRFNQFRNGVLTELARLGSGQFLIQRVDDDATAGPAIRLVRFSTTPAANDLLGFIESEGRNSAGNPVVYARMQTSMDSPTTGAERGQITWQIMRDGTLVNVLEWTGDGAIFQTPISVRGVGGQIPLIVNIASATGSLVRFTLNGNIAGSISVNGGGVVSYNTFTGSHWSEFHNSDETDPPEGTLLSTADSWHDQNRGLPRVEITKNPMCTRIYGVFGGRETSTQISVFALGTAPRVRCIGPIQAGDLLTSSDIPGVAQRQDDDLMRSSTLGKSVVTDLRTNERLIAANIMAG